MTDHFTYRITWSVDDDEYVGMCAEFPSLSWLAPTPHEAFSGIRQVVSDCVADMQVGNETPRCQWLTVPTAESSWCGCRRKHTAPLRCKLRRKA